jgi:hypothetical protein
MKSLEHTIRLVHEGKCCCDEKKSSLENTIRKVHKEHKREDIDASMSKVASFDKMSTEGMEYMGSGTTGVEKLHAESGKKKKELDEIGAVGTSKFQGPQFTTRQTVTPVIKPGHNEQSEKASNARNIAKVTKSPSIHGKIAEGKESIVKDAMKIAGVELKQPTSLGQLVVVGKEQLPSLVKKVEKKIKTQLPAIVKPETKVVTKPEVKTDTQTVTKTDTKVPSVTPVTTTEPKQDMVTKVATALGVPAAVIAAKTAPDVKAVPVVAPKADTPVPPPPVPGETPKAVPAAVPVSTSKSPKYPDIDYIDIEHRHRPPTITHKTKRRRVHENTSEDRKKIENMPRSDDDRKSIEYVGRKDADPKSIRSKTARNAEIKHKIIDEARKISSLIKKVHKDANKEAKEYREDGKTRVYPNVIVNPNLNRVDLNTYVDSGKVPNDYK